jgi:hypothetical protein
VFGAYDADHFEPFIEFLKTRPPATVTIDDRAWAFDGT